MFVGYFWELDSYPSYNVSLYLMYYHGSNKKREYEFLDLFLYYKPNSSLQKQHNKETLQLA